MADKVITIAGQRVKVSPFSDYYLEMIRLLFDSEGKLVFDLKRHSDLIAMAAEVVAPTLPKTLYRKVGEGYRWVGSLEAFSELVAGLWLSYWQFELDAAQAAKAPERIQMAEAQIEIVRSAIGQEAMPQLGEPTQQDTVDELKSELEKLRSQLNS